MESSQQAHGVSEGPKSHGLKYIHSTTHVLHKSDDMKSFVKTIE